MTKSEAVSFVIKAGNALVGYAPGGSTPDTPDYTVTDYSAKFELMCSSKPEHKTPYEVSDVTKTYSKGDIITVVGYTYNRYGNLWYKTANGGFIYYEYLMLDTMVQLLPPSNYVEATMKVETPDGAARWEKSTAYSGGEYLIKHEQGETFEITHYLYNSKGNLWYETSAGNYVFYPYLDVQSSTGWIPSDYVKGTIEIEIDGMPVRNIIQSSGSTVIDTLNRGDIKDIIGYAYNRYGNLWYVLGEDQVVFYDYCKNVGNSELPSDYCAKTLVVSQNTHLYDGNYWGTVTDDTVAIGTKVNTIAYVHNKYGSIYYELSNGKYIPDESLIPYNYTVNFDANGGNGSMSSMAVVYEEEFALPACTFAKPGYEFKGWNAKRVCDGKWYVSGKGWNSDEDIIANGYSKNLYSDEWEGYLNNSWANNITEADEYTLYAVWEKTTHSHSYTAVVTAPTCTEQGYTTYTCECGDSYVADYTNALGHNYVDGKCTRCGAADPDYKPVTNEGRIVVSDARARAGEEVSVSVSIEDNPGIMVMALGIDYDKSKLELIGFEDGIMTGWKVAKSAVWIGSDDVTANGVILKLKFKVLEDVEDGDIKVSLLFSEGDIANHNEDIIMPGISNGTITVYSHIPGDVTGDGKVNALDLVRLQRYLSGEDVVIGGSCDITGDGKINALDLVRLQRYLSGEGVEIC